VDDVQRAHDRSSGPSAGSAAGNELQHDKRWRSLSQFAVCVSFSASFLPFVCIYSRLSEKSTPAARDAALPLTGFPFSPLTLDWEDDTQRHSIYVDPAHPPRVSCACGDGLVAFALHARRLQGSEFAKKERPQVARSALPVPAAARPVLGGCI
jgi:hypothetical protein